jgi:pyridoxine 4-dehydrogenase
VERNLATLGIERVDGVNLRRLDLGPGITAEGDQVVAIEDQLAEMVALRDEGKIGAIGLSNTTTDRVRTALAR